MKKSFLLILGAAFLFGTMEVALKLAGAAFNPVQLTFLRFLIGGIVLLPLALYDLRKRQYRLTRGDWGYLLALGVICICISMLLFQLGIMRANANLAAIIISTSPVFTMIFAHFIADEKLTAQKGIVLLLNIIGLLIVANPVTLLHGKATAAGILLTLAAAVTFGLYTAMGKRKIDKIGGTAQNSFSFLLGSVVLLSILLFTRQPVLDGIRMSTLPLLIYTGIFVTGAGYFCYIKAIELSGPFTASLTFFIKPVFAPFIALAVLHEAITVNVVLGVVFILAGSSVSLIAARLKHLEMISILKSDDEDSRQ